MSHQPMTNPPPVPYATRPQTSGIPEASQLPNHPHNPLQRINAVYYPNYRVYRNETPASLDYHCISHVFYAFAHVSADGEVHFSDKYADLQKPVDGCSGCIASFVRLKEQNHDLRLLLSIGGGGASQNFAAIAANPVARHKFGRSAKVLVEANGFDGIDIDWEHPSNPEQGRDFLALLASIRTYLSDDRYLLTAALPAGQWALRNIDLYKAQDYLDLINLMAYDFTGSWTPTAGHHAQLFPACHGEPSGSAAVEYVIASGFPPAKILLGIPAYGRSFLGAGKPGDKYVGHGGDGGTFEYKELPRQGAHEVVDTNVVAAYCIGGDGGFISYDNPQTVRSKAEYCNSTKLGGLFYWTGTADTTSRERSLIATGFEALHGH